MQIKTNQVIGLPIYSIDEGKNIHKVEDVVYDPAAHRIQALIVDGGGIFSEGRALDIDDIKSIGEDAVIIQSESLLKKTSELEATSKRIANEDTYLTKSTVLTEDGTNLGKIVDLVFNSENGQVEELEISQGGIRDMQSGRKRIKPANIVTVGEDALIVSSFTEVAFNAQAEEGGAQGIFNQARKTAQETVNDWRNKWESPETQSKINEAQSNFESVVLSSKQKLEDVADQARTQFDQAKDNPETHQQLDELQQKAAHTAREVQSKAEDARESAADQFAEQKRRASSKIDEQMVKNQQDKETEAVGQYVTRNILDNHDKLIARRGEMVTHGILDQAKHAGSLDVVVNNVSPQPLSSYAGALGGEVERSDEDNDEKVPPHQAT